MEILILGGIMGVCLLFVWLCTQTSDAATRAKCESTPAPEWARLLFVLFFGGLLILCLAPGIMQGIK